MHKQFLQQNCLLKYGQSHNYNLFPYFYIFWKQSYIIKTHNYNLGQNQFPGRQLRTDKAKLPPSSMLQRAMHARRINEHLF
jgi:hypothetical protein